MRPGQNKRPRGGGGGGGGRQQANRKQGHGPNRTYDSNGPEIKIRGTAPHIYERYQQLARDAQSAGDRIAAENYLQHAEHYYRLMLANNLVFARNGANGNGTGPASPNGNVPGNGPQPEAPPFDLSLADGDDDDEGGELGFETDRA